MPFLGTSTRHNATSTGMASNGPQRRGLTHRQKATTRYRLSVININTRLWSYHDMAELEVKSCRKTLLGYCYTTSKARPPTSAAHRATNSAIHIYMAILPDIIIYTKPIPQRRARPNPSSTRPIAKNAFIRVLRGYTEQESRGSRQCLTARGRWTDDNPKP